MGSADVWSWCCLGSRLEDDGVCGFCSKVKPCKSRRQEQDLSGSSVNI